MCYVCVCVSLVGNPLPSFWRKCCCLEVTRYPKHRCGCPPWLPSPQWEPCLLPLLLFALDVAAPGESSLVSWAAWPPSLHLLGLTNSRFISFLTGLYAHPLSQVEFWSKWAVVSQKIVLDCGSTFLHARNIKAFSDTFFYLYYHWTFEFAATEIHWEELPLQIIFKHCQHSHLSLN